MRIVQFLFDEFQERKKDKMKEDTYLMAIAFSVAFSGDTSSLEELFGEEQIEGNSTETLDDFSIKRK